MIRRLPNLLVFASVVACSIGTGTREGVSWSSAPFPWDSPVEIDGARFKVTRLVDAATALPIAGAEVHLVNEESFPMAGRFWSNRSATTDRDGFARFSIDGLTRQDMDWVICFAKGYGPSGTDVFPEQIMMHRGLDLPIELLDHAGRPVAHADLAWVVSCGHGPDVRHAQTDGKGFATMTSVTIEGIADLYPVHPLLERGYASVYWRAGEEQVVLRWDPGRLIEGRVVDERGRPMQSLVVGVPTLSHRGAWTRTGKSGRFVVQGVPPEPCDIHVWEQDAAAAKNARPVRLGIFYHPFRDRPAQLVVRPVKLGDLPATERLSVHLAVSPGSGARSGIVVRASYEVDGDWRTVEALSDAEGAAELTVPRTALIIEAVPEDATLVPVRTELDLRKAATASLHLSLDPRPLLLLRVENLPPNTDRRIWVWRPGGGRYEVTALAAADGQVPVPPEGEFAFVLWADGTEVRFPVASFHDAPRPFVLRWPDPHRVSGRLVGPDGRPVPGFVSVPWDQELPERIETGVDGSFAFSTRLHRSIEMDCIPFDTDAFLPRLCLVALPAKDRSAPVECGDVVMVPRAAPQLRVLSTDGQPLAHGAATVQRPGRTLTSIGDGGAIHSLLNAEGAWTGDVLQAGDVVVVDLEPSDLDGAGPRAEETIHLPLRILLEGRGPWTLQVPSAELAILCVDGGELPVAAQIAFPGLLDFASTGEVGTLTLRHVPQGMHRVVAFASGHQACTVVVQIADGERRQLRIVLPGR